jgi:LacI family transcriptional regulator
MSVSLRDVAKTAKVSVGTVSNVLNRPEIVAEKTLNKVRETIKELGFVPNGFARHLRSGNSRTLGLVVPDVSNPFFTEVARGVEDAASKRDYAVFLCNTDESVTKEDRYINVLTEQQVRGVLITPSDSKADRLDVLRERGISVALIDREIKGQEQCSVSVDDINGGQLAIEYLTSLGHKDIAWVCGPESIPQVAERGAGVAKAAKASAANITTIRITLMNTLQGEEAARKILELPTRPTAIFCANDLLALGVIRILTTNKVKVPQQISVLGYDNIDFAASAGIPLSSIAQPAYQMGVTAANLLLDECEEGENHRHEQIRFQPQLIERSSTARRNT